MSRQIALLRGVNVGAHHRIAMPRLRTLVESLGCTNVGTFLQSGNVVFTSTETPEQTARRIETQLARDLGVNVSVLVRTRDELAQTVDRNPLRDSAFDPARFLVIFLSAEPDLERLDGLNAADFEPDIFRVAGREVYLSCPNGVLASRIGQSFWERRLGEREGSRYAA